MNIHKTAVGIGLRSFLYKDVASHIGTLSPLNSAPDFFEVHPENYTGGGLDYNFLQQLSHQTALSFQSVGLSLGSFHPPHKSHLDVLKRLNDIFQPALFSDHVAWSTNGNGHLNDLLPVPYNKESLGYIGRNVDIVQNILGRQIIMENLSSYLELKASTYDEPSFLNEMCRKSGCGLLLDINNIYAQSFNHNFSARGYIDQIKSDLVQEYHLAGHQHYEGETCTLKIDTHDQQVCDDVWNLYAYAIDTKGFAPTLIEWDSNCPSYDVLCTEAQKTRAIIEEKKERCHA